MFDNMYAKRLKDKQVNGVDVTIVMWESDSYSFGDADFWMQLHEEIRQAGFYPKYEITRSVKQNFYCGGYRVKVL